MPSTSAATKRSWICSVTIRREDAVQRCPVWKKAPLIAQLDRDVEIGVVEHHERVLAAHLELEPGEARGAFLRDVAAGVDRSR